MSETAESRPATSTSSSRATSVNDVREDPRSASRVDVPGTAYARIQLQENRNDQYGRRAIIFTGPDGLKPYKLATDQVQYIGENDKSRENTDALSYLFRPPKGMPFPKAKNGQISETGWEIEHLGRGRYT